MQGDIFSVFRDAARDHSVNYINCKQNPDQAALGFMRTQYLNCRRFPKRSYERYLVSFDSESDAEGFVTAFPEIVARAGLHLYRSVYFRDGRDVHVIFNSVDMNGARFGMLEDMGFRLASR